MYIIIHIPLDISTLAQVQNDAYRPIIDNLLLSFQSINKLSTVMSAKARLQAGVRACLHYPSESESRWRWRMVFVDKPRKSKWYHVNNWLFIWKVSLFFISSFEAAYWKLYLFTYHVVNLVWTNSEFFLL